MNELKDVDHNPLVVDLGDDDPGRLIGLQLGPQAQVGLIYFHRAASVVLAEYLRYQL